MTHTKDEALDLALEALERGVATCFDKYSHEQVMCRPEHFINQAITAIKQALAADVQEPVATLFGSLPVYDTPSAAQRQWVGLTDEEIIEAAGIDGADTWLFETAYAIEAKLKEKNA